MVVIEMGRSTLTADGTIPWAGAPEWIKKMKQAEYQHPPLSAFYVWIHCDQLPTPSLLWLLCRDELCPQTVCQNRPFLKSASSACFFHSNGKSS